MQTGKPHSPVAVLIFNNIYSQVSSRVDRADLEILERGPTGWFWMMEVLRGIQGQIPEESLGQSPQKLKHKC